LLRRIDGNVLPGDKSLVHTSFPRLKLYKLYVPLDNMRLVLRVLKWPYQDSYGGRSEGVAWTSIPNYIYSVEASAPCWRQNSAARIARYGCIALHYLFLVLGLIHGYLGKYI